MSRMTALACAGSALLASTLIAPAMAADNHFAGAYAVVAADFVKSTVKSGDEQEKKSETTPSLAIGYNLGLTNRITLGLKLTADLKNGEFAKPEGVEVQEKRHFSLAVEPGYAFTDKILGFGILSYHTARMTIISEESKAIAAERNLSGLGYGLGAKYALTHNIFVVAEMQKVTYGDVYIFGNTFKTSQTVTSVGVGYHF